MNIYNKKMKQMMRIFNGFRKVNLATHLYNYSKKHLSFKYIFFFIPFLLFGINIYNMLVCDVLYSYNKEFTYMADMSNSLGLTALFFISYFLSGYFPQKYDEYVCKGICEDIENKGKEKRRIFLWIFLALLLFAIGFGAGYSFHATAKSNATAYWIYNLSKVGRLYYCFFLGSTWYHSLSLLGMALSAGGVIFFSIKGKNIIYVDENYNKNFSIVKASDILIYTFAYGVFYITGAILFIVNDHIAMEKYDVINAFADDITSFWLMIIVTAIVILAFVPLHELLCYMKERREEMLIEVNQKIEREYEFEKKRELIEYRNNIYSQGLIFTSFSSRLVLFLSVMIPLIGVIFQGIDLLVQFITEIS